MKTKSHITVLAALAALATGCQDDGPICDAGQLTAALGAAGAGDVVTIGVCRLAGAFTVPAGVTLSGAGAGLSKLEPSGGSAVVTLEVGAGVTRVEGLDIAANGRAGLIAVSDEGGVVEVEDVGIASDNGLIAAGFQGLDSVSIRDAQVLGTVTRDNAGSIIGDTGTYGLVLAGVESADLTDVEVNGFSLYGVLAVDSGLSWAGGNASANLRTGLRVEGGSADLDGVSLDETFQGFQAYAFAGLFVNTTVDSTGVEVSSNEIQGLVHIGSEVRHDGLTASENGHVALWAQACSRFSLTGASVLSGNAFAGLVANGTDVVEVSDASIGSTRSVSRVAGEMGTIEVGDGIELLNPGAQVALERVTLDGNERAGLVIDLGGADMSASDFTVEEVTVSGADTAFGAVAQHGAPVAGWDAGVRRDAVTTANDAAFASPLDVPDFAIAPTAIIGDTGGRVVTWIIGDTGGE